MEYKNFHTHTKRCQHAYGDDEEYVLQAILEGFSILGFSDHTPWPYDETFVSNIRMHSSQMDEYVASIRTLQEKYKSKIKLLVGLECEYFPQYFPYLDEMIAKHHLDYLLLGNHFKDDEKDGLYYGNSLKPKDLEDYANSTVFAIQSNRFAYLAHPDVVFSNYPVFDDFCREISHKICKAAALQGIPLEYNLIGIEKANAGSFNGIGYPCDEFWKIVKEYQCKVIVGIDAHKPSQLQSSQFSDITTKLVSEGHCVTTQIALLHGADDRVMYN